MQRVLVTPNKEGHSGYRQPAYKPHLLEHEPQNLALINYQITQNKLWLRQKKEEYSRIKQEKLQLDQNLKTLRIQAKLLQSELYPANETKINPFNYFQPIVATWWDDTLRQHNAKYNSSLSMDWTYRGQHIVGIIGDLKAHTSSCYNYYKQTDPTFVDKLTMWGKGYFAYPRTNSERYGNKNLSRNFYKTYPGYMLLPDQDIICSRDTDGKIAIVKLALIQRELQILTRNEDEFELLDDDHKDDIDPNFILDCLREDSANFQTDSNESAHAWDLHDFTLDLNLDLECTGTFKPNQVSKMLIFTVRLKIMLLSKIKNMTQDFEVDNLKASGGRGIHSHAHARSSSESESGNKKPKRSIKATEDRQTKRQCRIDAYAKADTKPAIDRQETFSSGAENSSSDSSDSDSNSETGLESPSESKNQKRPSNNNAKLITNAGGNHYDHRSYNKVIKNYNTEQSPRDSDSDSNSGALGKNYNNRSYNTVAGNLNTKVTYNFG